MMRRPRLRTIAKWFLILLVPGLIFALRAGIWITERVNAVDTSGIPSSARNITNGSFLNQIHDARIQAMSMLKERSIPGLSVAISKNGTLIYSEAFGYSNLETKERATSGTQFRIHSVSKLFTAALLGRLYQEGRINLRKDIRAYVPEFPDKGYVITAELLASHRSGIRTYRNDAEASGMKQYPDVTASLDMFKNDPLLFPPGAGYSYSVYGYVLLSAVLERAGGKDFLTLMNNEVLSPLHLQASHAASSQHTFAQESIYYDNVTPYSPDGSTVRSPANDFSFKWASGGFVSTSEDLVKFGDAHIPSLNRGFLHDTTIDELFRPRTSQLGILNIGLGWMSARDLHLRKVYFHFGAGSGGTAFLAIYPEQQVSVAILANLGHANFPFARIMNIVNPFLVSPTQFLFNCILVAFALAIGLSMYRRWSRGKRNRSRRKHLGAITSTHIQ